MQLLTTDQLAMLRTRFIPDQPSRLLALHVIATGNGVGYADRWPEPRAMVLQSANNYQLAGDLEALTSAELRARIAGFVDAPPTAEPLLRAAWPDLHIWPRIIFELPAAPSFSLPQQATVRRLVAADAEHLRRLTPESAWIANTWGGPDDLAASGFGWGAFVAGSLAAVACTFYLGDRHEELGVVTEAPWRGLGLSGACAGSLCEDIRRRGRRPCWSTSPDNTASLRVAQKLGFVVQRHDRLYVAGSAIPQPPRREQP